MPHGLKVGIIVIHGFEPHFNPDLYIACEKCIDRCPPEARTMGEDGVPEVGLDKGFGCAVCATGCLEEAIKMVNNPVFSQPPKDGKALKEAIMFNKN